MYSLTIEREDDKKRIKGMYDNFIQNFNMTPEQAIEQILMAIDFRLDLKDKILHEVWRHGRFKKEIEEDYVYYPNDRDVIVEGIADDTSKSFRYVFNIFYELHHDGLLDTKLVVNNKRRYTLVTLTHTGMNRIEDMLGIIRFCVEQSNKKNNAVT